MAHPRESLLSTFMKPQIFEADNLTSAEWMDVTRFFSMWPQTRRQEGKSLDRSFRGGFALPSVAIFDTGVAQASPLHRLAVLVFMSYLKEKKSTIATFEYLNKFYRLALDLYKSGTGLEVIYAWYVISIYTLLAGDSIGTAIAHCHQYCRALVALKTSIQDDDDRQFLDIMWMAVIGDLFTQHRDSIELFHLDDPTTLHQSIEQIHLLLKQCSILLPSLEQIVEPRRCATPLWVGQYLETLAIYMQYYLDLFLFRMEYINSDVHDTDNLRFALRNICERVLQLITHFPDIVEYIEDAYFLSSTFSEEQLGNRHTFLQFPPVRPRSVKGPSTPPEERDTAIAFAYTFARLLRNMLDPVADSNETTSTDIYLSAIALCRLCASFPNRGHPYINITIPHRTLFWAGLILTKSRFPAGASPVSLLIFAAHEWIMEGLRQCINSGISYRGVTKGEYLKDEERIVVDMMEMADNRASFEDIWKISSGGISLFFYTIRMVPWFRFTSLTRARYRGTGGNSRKFMWLDRPPW